MGGGWAFSSFDEGCTLNEEVELRKEEWEAVMVISGGGTRSAGLDGTATHQGKM